MENLFIQASRKKLRFTTGKGEGSVEELWTLPLTKLDAIASEFDAEIEKAGKRSRLAVRTAAATELELKLGIVDYIITTRQEELEASVNRLAKQQEIEKLTSLVNNKKDAALNDLSVEELQKRLDLLKG